MAIYQFIMELIPKEWDKKNKNNAILLYDGEQYDTSIAWQSNQPKVDFIFISEILPKGKSWHSDLQVWGDDERHDIKILMDDKKEVESITIRLDLRCEINEILEKVIFLANKLDCVFFLPEFKKIINPSYSTVRQAISSSNPARYVE